jgi:hypothetical protein
MAKIGRGSAADGWQPARTKFVEEMEAFLADEG